jgi:hypothetical protein
MPSTRSQKRFLGSVIMAMFMSCRADWDSTVREHKPLLGGGRGLGGDTSLKDALSLSSAVTIL